MPMLTFKLLFERVCLRVFEEHDYALQMSLIWSEVAYNQLYDGKTERLEEDVVDEWCESFIRTKIEESNFNLRHRLASGI